MNASAPGLLAAALAVCAPAHAEPPPLQGLPLGGTATKLSTAEYFEPPNDNRVKLRLTGAETTPLTNAMFDVRQLEVQQFSADGRLQAVVQAPRCIYALEDGVASSTGHLDLKLDGDRIHVQGEGFLWRQNPQSLVISNQVSTVIKMGTWRLTGL